MGRMESSQALAAHPRRPARCSATRGMHWSVARAPAYRRHVCLASHHASRVLLERILPHLAPIHRRAAVSAMAGRTHPRLAANPAASAVAAPILRGSALPTPRAATYAAAELILQGLEQLIHAVSVAAALIPRGLARWTLRAAVSVAAALIPRGLARWTLRAAASAEAALIPRGLAPCRPQFVPPAPLVPMVLAREAATLLYVLSARQALTPQELVSTTLLYVLHVQGVPTAP